MATPDFRIQKADWATDREKLLSVRNEVFVIEQNVPAEIEIDEFDPISRHVLALETSTNKPIGTARLLPEGRIGRVAVLQPWRKSGVGAAMMEFMINEAITRGHSELMLHAQTWTVGFYQKHGFTSEGDEFEEANIPHFTMRLSLR